VRRGAAAGTWVVHWTGDGATPEALAASVAVPSWALAAAPHAAGSLAVRCGARVIGTPPLFPSAAVVICRENGGTWTDVALAEESPDRRVVTAAIAVEGDDFAVAYLAPDSTGQLCCRLIESTLGRLASPPHDWGRLPDYPQPPGMAGLMAGLSGGALIAAGGANFPTLPPWEKGIKAYYDEIHVLEPGRQAWRPGGRLPAARAYGATVTTPDGVLIIGGEDSGQIFGDCLRLRWDGRAVEVTQGPTLPAPITSAVAEVVDGYVYVAGGYAAGTPRLSTKTFWRLSLAQPESGWEILPAWSGPTRALAVAASLGGAFYLISGLEMRADGTAAAPAVYLTDAHRFWPDRGWERLSDLPWSAIAAASPAPVSQDPPRVFVLGGVDGRQVGHLPRTVALPNDILAFDVATGAWTLRPEAWPKPVVCVPAVASDAGWLIASGESMAGVRTTEAWSWVPVG